MWVFERQTKDSNTQRIEIYKESRAVSYGEVINLWKEDSNFRREFRRALLQETWDEFFWENPPVNADTLDRGYEFVLIKAPALKGILADSTQFQQHFRNQSNEPVLTFPNLGGDAQLVVPTPVAQPACYAHFASFLRCGPDSQIDAFWREVGGIMSTRISAEPLWLSTSGLGVSWLHLRLDTRPKYYRYAPYRMLN